MRGSWDVEAAMHSERSVVSSFPLFLPVRTLIVDEERRGRERLRSLLERTDEVEVVGEFESVAEAVESIDLVAQDPRGCGTAARPGYVHADPSLSHREQDPHHGGQVVVEGRIQRDPGERKVGGSGPELPTRRRGLPRSSGRAPGSSSKGKNGERIGTEAQRVTPVQRFDRRTVV